MYLQRNMAVTLAKVHTSSLLRVEYVGMPSKTRTRPLHFHLRLTHRQALPSAFTCLAQINTRIVLSASLDTSAAN